MTDDRPTLRLSGKAAIVTGAGSGIGAASATLLARDGAGVVIADIDLDGANEVATAIVADGGRAIAVRADVSQEADVQAMVAAAVEEFGALHVLHNNAAVTSPARLRLDTAVSEMDVELWDFVMAVNVRGNMLGCKHAAPEIARSGGGSIINTSSQAGPSGDLAMTAYGTSKAAINGLTRYVATQFGRAGVRCNAILPGMVLTEDRKNDPAPVRAALAASTLLPYLAETDDVAELVAFLASDASRSITGQLIGIDGGYGAHQPTFAHFSEMMAQAAQ